MSNIQGLIENILPKLIVLRHELHQCPELAYGEFRTAKRLLSEFSQLSGLIIETGLAETGIKVVLNSDKPGPCLALRADMDALPIKEESNLAYVSQNQGVMHACGHDGHMTCLVGALKILYQLREQIKTPVVFIFQPAEELELGAKKMIDAGVLLNPTVDAIFALHGWPDLPLGSVATRSGPIMAGNSDFDITITGQGAHAAMPHKSIDPIVVGAQLVQALQILVSRTVSPIDQLVVTIGEFNAGSNPNIISESAKLTGTVRYFDDKVGEEAIRKFEKICAGLAQAFEAEIVVKWPPGNLPVVNDHKTTNFFKEVICAELGKDVVAEDLRPVMASEDFSYYQRHVPGTFWGLGVKTARTTELHQPNFNFPDEAIALGVRIHVELALNFGRFA